jgi:hypothetical protein
MQSQLLQGDMRNILDWTLGENKANFELNKLYFTYNAEDCRGLWASQ